MLDQISKNAQIVEKHSQLLQQSKHYEFAQKIKMLALRKTQTNKLEQAQQLLRLGIQKMFKTQIFQSNACHQIVIALLDFYEANQVFWKNNTGKEIFDIIQLRPQQRNIEYYNRILKTISQPRKCPQISQFVISYFENKNMFGKVQAIVAYLDISRIQIFLDRWSKVINKQQYYAVLGRMALLKGLLFDFDQTMVLLSFAPSNNPFVRFVKLLIQSVQLKSRQSYDKIQSVYKKFLDKDSFYRQMFVQYGVKYFKKQRQNSGLLGLFK